MVKYLTVGEPPDMLSRTPTSVTMPPVSGTMRASTETTTPDTVSASTRAVCIALAGTTPSSRVSAVDKTHNAANERSLDAIVALHSLGTDAPRPVPLS
jgi:hypothetical protein